MNQKIKDQEKKIEEQSQTIQTNQQIINEMTDNIENNKSNGETAMMSDDDDENYRDENGQIDMKKMMKMMKNTVAKQMEEMGKK